MTAFIISYNRLTWLRNLANELAKFCQVVIVDNGSTYEPLLKWLNGCEYKVCWSLKNFGHQVVWKTNLLETYGIEGRYIVTDHDLDISELPKDWIDVLNKGLDLFPNVIKSGLSLRINDLPVNNYTKEVINWENKFWTDKKHGYYQADIDTTLAIYDTSRKFGELPNNRFFSAVRSPEPYTAKHLPWYNTELTAEEKYYLDHTGTYWAGKYRELI